MSHDGVHGVGPPSGIPNESVESPALAAAISAPVLILVSVMPAADLQCIMAMYLRPIGAKK